MQIVDTHTHLYLKEFEEDLELTLQRAQKVGVNHFFLPNIDSSTLEAVTTLSARKDYTFHPMWGLHPCSVNENWQQELVAMKVAIEKEKPKAIGEIGFDLYWDSTFEQEQRLAFREQCAWALELDLPIAIHVRNAFELLFEEMDQLDTSKLRGVFHCFSGGLKEAEKALSYPHFLLGIGGVVTFKNGGLDRVLPEVPIDRIVVETDAPYLAPVPYRGKRNEPSYLPLIVDRIATIKGLSSLDVAHKTTQNACQLFDFEL